MVGAPPCSGKICDMKWHRIGISALIAVALVAIVAGFMQAQTATTSASLVDPGIEVLVPSPASSCSVSRRWASISRRDTRARSTSTARPFPTTSSRRTTRRTRCSSSRGPGKEFEQFAPGRHCVTAHFYQTVQGPDTSPHLFLVFQRVVNPRRTEAGVRSRGSAGAPVPIERLAGRSTGGVGRRSRFRQAPAKGPLSLGFTSGGGRRNRG